MTTRRRLDAEMVRRHMVASRQEAKRQIEAGQVVVDGAPAQKAARLVSPGQNVALLADRPRYVSRAGFKLEAALDEFGVDPAGRHCLDAGSSTGGFTDCLLQRGATRVIAVDVGTNQLHERLRGRDRVDVRERCDVRTLVPDDIGGPVELLVADLSFISLRLVLGALDRLTLEGCPILTLVKPQFEAGRAEASQGKGVITDPTIWRRVLSEVVAAAADLNLGLRAATVSPITGASGNVEFITWLESRAPALDRRSPEPISSVLDIKTPDSRVLDDVVARAEARGQ